MLAKNIVIHLYWSVDSFKRIYRVNQYFAVRELIFEFPLFYVRITIQGFDTFPMLSICLLYRWYKEITKKKTISRYKTTYNTWYAKRTNDQGSSIETNPGPFPGPSLKLWRIFVKVNFYVSRDKYSQADIKFARKRVSHCHVTASSQPISYRLLTGVGTEGNSWPDN